MSAEPRQYVIAELLANAIEPWDNLTARELEALGVRMAPDSPLTAPVVIAAYSNERGPVLIDGAERLQWLASAPGNRKTISADEVRIDPDAVDPESAHLAAVALRVNRREAPTKVKAGVARKLQAQFGWSQATIAEIFQVSGPAVSKWLRQMSGSDVPEITGADGRTYPARGKQADQDKPAAGGTVSEALKALHVAHEAVVLRYPQIRHVRVDRHGKADPSMWTVTIPGQSAKAAADVAARLRDQANDLTNLASRLEQAGS